MFRIGAVICFSVPILGACHGPASRAPDPARGPDGGASRDASPAGAFTLTLSSGGGFAGSWQGCTLASTGEATGWSRTAAGPRTDQWVRKADPDSLRVFARELEACSGNKLEGTGNMTLRLEYATPRADFRWSVPASGPAPEAPGTPEPFRTLYPRIEAYCRGLAPVP